MGELGSDRDRVTYDLAMVFTGHRIDEPGRAIARFPASAEAAVRRAIREAVLGQLEGLRAGSAVGVAGGASGGDLLFHEVCAELGVRTVLRLALPVGEFLEASVAGAGLEWVRRFGDLIERLGVGEVKVLAASGADENVWERTNVWLLDEAAAMGREQVLLALWDGKGGDGAGGTEHMIQIARERGVRVGAVIGL